MNNKDNYGSEISISYYDRQDLANINKIISDVNNYIVELPLLYSHAPERIDVKHLGALNIAVEYIMRKIWRDHL